MPAAPFPVLIQRTFWGVGVGYVTQPELSLPPVCIETSSFRISICGMLAGSDFFFFSFRIPTFISHTRSYPIHPCSKKEEKEETSSLANIQEGFLPSIYPWYFLPSSSSALKHFRTFRIWIFLSLIPGNKEGKLFSGLQIAPLFFFFFFFWHKDPEKKLFFIFF